MEEDGEEQRQSNSPFELATRLKCVGWPDDSIAISIEECAMLLQNLGDMISMFVLHDTWTLDSRFAFCCFLSLPIHLVVYH